MKMKSEMSAKQHTDIRFKKRSTLYYVQPSKKSPFEADCTTSWKKDKPYLNPPCPLQQEPHSTTQLHNHRKVNTSCEWPIVKQIKTGICIFIFIYCVRLSALLCMPTFLQPQWGLRNKTDLRVVASQGN